MPAPACAYLCRMVGAAGQPLWAGALCRQHLHYAPAASALASTRSVWMHGHESPSRMLTMSVCQQGITLQSALHCLKHGLLLVLNLSNVLFLTPCTDHALKTNRPAQGQRAADLIGCTATGADKERDCRSPECRGRHSGPEVGGWA